MTTVNCPCITCVHNSDCVCQKDEIDLDLFARDLSCLDYEPKEDDTCSACGGSGHYDSTGSPKCGACDGTGKKRKN